jgi:hypothetical protein
MTMLQRKSFMHSTKILNQLFMYYLLSLCGHSFKFICNILLQKTYMWYAWRSKKCSFLSLYVPYKTTHRQLLKSGFFFFTFVARRVIGSACTFSLSSSRSTNKSLAPAVNNAQSSLNSYFYTSSAWTCITSSLSCTLHEKEENLLFCCKMIGCKRDENGLDTDRPPQR